MNDESEIFLDPNTFSNDGTVAIQQQSWTEDGSILAYGISEKGSDWVTIKVNLFLIYFFDINYIIVLYG